MSSIIDQIAHLSRHRNSLTEDMIGINPKLALHAKLKAERADVDRKIAELEQNRLSMFAYKAGYGVETIDRAVILPGSLKSA